MAEPPEDDDLSDADELSNADEVSDAVIVELPEAGEEVLDELE